MTDDMMRYDLMVEQALRTVVREAMGRVAQDGLPGEHHLYITFRTGEEGVSLPDYLIERYPDEMTIVLQHQFEDFTVDHGGFAVSLNFNNVQERLRIPFASISAFRDNLLVLQSSVGCVAKRSAAKRSAAKPSAASAPALASRAPGAATGRWRRRGAVRRPSR